ncbi:interferon-inducible GTPase 5-like isoform X1 [Conger conger]|uniref:interferon-inducible GTPase 5-like isoform X1 n=1 Tax=Conger conger TaxID=82655 RepID=UPI002A5A73A0|nr:interferon-inducible GTPase 5-like isoform X1 [Conger conger]
MARLQTISEGEIQQMSSVLQSRVVTEVVAQVQSMLGQRQSSTLDIAVTGESGSGKSTFINAFRGIADDDDPRAAKTGVTETTQEIIAYDHPTAPTVRLWDLPGIGTPTFQPQRYLEDVGLTKYDFFIIVASERFRECHVTLASCVAQAGKKFYFVRNKVDNDLEASARRRGRKGLSEEAVLREIRDDCKAGLQRIGAGQPQVFLLSCFQPQRFDFALLHETLERELEGHKRHVFLLALPNLTAAVLERKQQALAGSVWQTAMAACLSAATPGGAVHSSVPMLMSTLQSFQRSFGLDTNSLLRLANMTGKSYQELYGEVRSTSGRELSMQTVEGMLSQVALGQQVLSGLLESRIPVLGNIISGGVSFMASYSLLKSAIKDLREDAERVMHRALDGADDTREDVPDPGYFYAD